MPCVRYDFVSKIYPQGIAAINQEGFCTTSRLGRMRFNHS